LAYLIDSDNEFGLKNRPAHSQDRPVEVPGVLSGTGGTALFSLHRRESEVALRWLSTQNGPSPICNFPIAIALRLPFENRNSKIENFPIRHSRFENKSVPISAKINSH
jgi:hypothetical protein